MAGFTGGIAHLALIDGTMTAAQAVDFHAAVKTGWSGETSTARIIRYAGWAGVTDVVSPADPAMSRSIAHIDTTGQTPAALIQLVADTEGAPAYIDRSGRLIAPSRAARFNQATAVSVDASTVDASVTIAANTSELINDVTITRAAAPGVHVNNPASIKANGLRAKSFQSVTTVDREVVDRAQWIVGSASTPDLILPALTFDLLTLQSSAASLLALELGSVVSVTGMPAQAPTASLLLEVLGLTETWSVSSWSLSVSVADDTGMQNVLTLDDPVFGLLDSNVLAF